MLEILRFEKILRAHNTHKEEIHVLYRKSFISIKGFAAMGRAAVKLVATLLHFTRNPRGGKQKQ